MSDPTRNVDYTSGKDTYDVDNITYLLSALKEKEEEIETLKIWKEDAAWLLSEWQKVGDIIDADLLVGESRVRHAMIKALELKKEITRLKGLLANIQKISMLDAG